MSSKLVSFSHCCQSNRMNQIGPIGEFPPFYSQNGWMEDDYVCHNQFLIGICGVFFVTLASPGETLPQNFTKELV